MTELAFRAEGGDPLAGLLVYSDVEHSFRFEAASPVDLGERTGDLGRTSLAIGTLQIELDVATGRVLFVWGLHPRQRWRAGLALPRRARRGVVRAERPAGFQRGVSIVLTEVGDWTTIHDSRSGWVWIAVDPALADDDELLVASETILGLRSGRLNSVWLHPVFENGEPVSLSEADQS